MYRCWGVPRPFSVDQRSSGAHRRHSLSDIPPTRLDDFYRLFWVLRLSVIRHGFRRGRVLSRHGTSGIDRHRDVIDVGVKVLGGLDKTPSVLRAE